MMLPPHWHTDRLRMADAQPADTDDVLACLAESADVAALDPTFGPAPRAEIDELIAKSQREAGVPLRGFQMQMMRRSDDGRLVGYWHLTRIPQKDQAVGVSILLLRPAHRGQGLGQELVTAAATHLAPQHHEFWSRVFLANPRAIEFWAGLGFSQLIRHRNHFVQPPAETPSVVLVKTLASGSA